MRAPRFWHSPNLTATLLSPLSCLYGAASWVRWKYAKPWVPPVPVICVGNVVAGGAGKTPLVLLLHRYFQAQGMSAFIVSRGYKGTLYGPVNVDRARHTAAEVGDEPLLIAHHASCIVAKNRRQGIEAAVRAGAQVVVLDDGLQNPSVKKTFSFLVMDGEYGLGNGKRIPAGPLREPLSQAIARAQAIVLVGEDKNGLQTRMRHAPVLRAAIRPNHPDHVRGKRYVAFAGIGRPEKFFTTLRNCGADVVETIGFGDHHVFSETELRQLQEKAHAHRAVLITTEKDFFRLPRTWQTQVKTLAVEMVMEDQEALEKMLALLTAQRRMAPSFPEFP